MDNLNGHGVPARARAKIISTAGHWDVNDESILMLKRLGGHLFSEMRLGPAQCRPRARFKPRRAGGKAGD